MMRKPLFAVVLLLASCGGGISVGEYAEDVEALVVTMNAGLDALDAELSNPTLDDVRRYTEGRVRYRTAFIEAMRALEPPDDTAELHATALVVMERVAAAEIAMAERAGSWRSDADVVDIWSTPEGIAARIVDQDAIALCLAAQERFDATRDRAGFSETLWVPPEMKEVIIVAFGCLADQR